jgi:hypothetical protein
MRMATVLDHDGTKIGPTSEIHTGENGLEYTILNSSSRSGRPSYTLVLLKTCRQIYAEACLSPLELNTFELSDSLFGREDLDSWASMLGRRMDCIRTVRLHTLNASISESLRFLDELEASTQFLGLRAIEVLVVVEFWNQDEFPHGPWYRHAPTTAELLMIRENESVVAGKIEEVLGSSVELDFVRFQPRIS